MVWLCLVFFCLCGVVNLGVFCSLRGMVACDFMVSFLCVVLLCCGVVAASPHL